MRNLRLYNTDAAFKAHEQAAGGDGLSTETVVPGVSMSKDIRKRYFNPKDKSKLVFDLTIRYKDESGMDISSSAIQSEWYYSGVSQDLYITPKNIGGYSPKDALKKVTIPDTSSVNLIYEMTHESAEREYLTLFIIANAAYGQPRSVYLHGDKTLSYKLNDGDWTSITMVSGGSYGAEIQVKKGDIIKLKGNNNSYNGCYINSTSPYVIYGNIMSLVYGDDFYGKKTLAGLGDGIFSYFFKWGMRENNLRSAKYLILPAVELTANCYSYMFKGSSGLTEAPELPATKLASACYRGMFSGCKALTSAPELPATELTEDCYYEMFRWCESLVKAPVLPATTLASRCYYSMFASCSSLVNAPALPATTLASSCYYSMFAYCTSLVNAPALPATTLADYCYDSMFYGCTSLTSAPVLPATTLASSCYYSMFYGCTSLEKAPILPATSAASACCIYICSADVRNYQ